MNTLPRLAAAAAAAVALTLPLVAAAVPAQAGSAPPAPAATSPAVASRAAVVRALATAPAPAAPAGGSVTLLLRAAHPRRLAQLASHGVSVERAATAVTLRAAAVAATLPSSRERAGVVAAARRLGFAAAATGPWTVTLGGSAAAVLRDFGSATALRPGDPVAQPLPRIPASLAAAVSLALGGNDTRPMVRPLGLSTLLPRAVPAGTYSGAELAQAYHTHVGPAAPGYGGQTIATLQFSGWNQNDLATYAQTAFGSSFPDPVTDGQYTGISVDGASQTTPDAAGDDVEVALDQEALLGVAPTARQRAYFTANTASGIVAALQQVASDATNPALHIVALSDSYGECEPDYRATLVTQLNQLFEQLVAEGVTVFGPSGDTGSADCYKPPQDSSLANAVDFPGSSPAVVSVGGTTLSLGPPASETAWTCASVPGQCSGGGASQVFPRPAYQSGLAIGGTARLVPDIATDANPSPGYYIYDSLQGGPMVAGGTSLSTPTSAALLTDELIDAGVNSGIGNIHSVLYRAPTADFGQVQPGGSNGAFTAGSGYDEVTGLGAPLWDSLRQALVSATTTYHPLTPTRVLDTRSGVGGFTGTVGPKQAITLSLAGGSTSGVPAGAAAVVLNVTAIQTSAASYISVYPTGDSAGPASSNLNVPWGATVANLVVSRLSPAGAVTLYNSAGKVYLVADVEGYYTADSTGAFYSPTAPTRILNTADGTGTGGSTAPLGPGGTVTVAVAGVSGVPTDATAVAITLTATQVTATTFLSAYPAGQTGKPTTSTLNLLAGQTRANLAIVPLSSGSFTVYNNQGSAEAIADLEGYYTAGSSGLYYHPLAPQRVLDTRIGLGAPTAPVGSHGTLTFTVAGLQGEGVPAGAGAVVVNLTGTAPTSTTYLSLYPAGDTTGSQTSVLNLVGGETAPDLTVVPVASTGTVTVYNNLGSTQVVADVEGYFAGP